VRSSLHRQALLYSIINSICVLELTSDEYLWLTLRDENDNVQDAKEALGGSTWFGGNPSVGQ